ncbi:MAG: tyrosine-type recombinase/integrase [bacterium]
MGTGEYVYYVDFRFRGRRFVRSTGTNKKQLANQILDDIRGNIARGKFHLEDIEETNISFNDFIEEYLETHAKITKCHGSVLIDIKALNEFRDRVGGNIALRTIDENMATRHRAYLVNRQAELRDSHGIKKRLSPATVNMRMRSLRTAFNWALRRDPKYLDKNVFAGMKQLPVDKLTPRSLDDQDLIALFKAIRADKKKVRSKLLEFYISFLLLTGCRKSEALELTWSDYRQDVGFLLIDRTKTKIGRGFPVSAELKELLDEIRATYKPKKVGEKIFDMSKDRATKGFKRYAKKAGLPENVHLHCLRHTNAFIHRKAGAELMDIKDALGHKDIETTMVYAKALPEHLRSMVSNISVKKFRNGEVSPEQPPLENL